MNGPNRRLGYLSASLRSSIRSDSETSAPRAKILGTIKGFQACGWDVKTFIAGDRMPRSWSSKGSERILTGGVFRVLAADIMRLVVSSINAHLAWKELGGKVDVVYERFAVLQSLGWIFKRHGVPWILETVSPHFYEAKAERKSMMLDSLAHLLEMKAYRACDFLVCVSEPLKIIIAREAGISQKKILVVPNGIDTDLFDPGKYSKKRLFENFTIGFVGNLNRWQGLDTLFKALRGLLNEGINISLVIVGDGIMADEWKKTSLELGLSSKVVFVGRMPMGDIPSYIAGFDICYCGQVQTKIGPIFNSPLKIYEYMAMGKPVISSKFDDALRVIRDRETGFFFETGNAKDLTRVIRNAYKSQEMLPAMGYRAREDAIAKYSWKIRIQSMLEGIKKMDEKINI